MMNLIGLLMLSICVTSALANSGGSGGGGGGIGKVRRYFVQAEEQLWDYAPSGRNNFADTPIEEGVSGAVLTGSFCVSC
jgi:hypothetical protein